MLYYFLYLLGYIEDEYDDKPKDYGGKTYNEILENIKKKDIEIYSRELLYSSVIEELKKKLKLIN